MWKVTKCRSTIKRGVRSSNKEYIEYCKPREDNITIEMLKYGGSCTIFLNQMILRELYQLTKNKWEREKMVVVWKGAV